MGVSDPVVNGVLLLKPIINGQNTWIIGVFLPTPKQVELFHPYNSGQFFLRPTRRGHPEMMV